MGGTVSHKTGSRASAGVPWLGAYLVIGLVFQLLYWGLPWPQYLGTWLHVLLWPVYVVLGMLRRLFIPFAFVALLGFAAVWFLTAGSRRR